MNLTASKRQSLGSPPALQTANWTTGLQLTKESCWISWLQKQVFIKIDLPRNSHSSYPAQLISSKFALQMNEDMLVSVVLCLQQYRSQESYNRKSVALYFKHLLAVFPN
ncbi:unnamed protein product [Didymodactylos carnosus]|uniref:Uncharacterized protein n=1 Tax=Didymodactylos carnosus TaxID=1234261 RepID=A0A8S2VU85_9BILA|nr:unnamed protein product [Didymodactylos carnosus]CAF4417524.1 unnamed protein product [Didymodactylos carnosus]